MTDCRDESLLQAWIDGELSSSVSEAVRSHLAACTGCAARVRDAERALSMIGDACVDAGEWVPTARLRAHLEAELASPREARPPRRAVLSWWGAIAAASVFVVGILGLLFERQQPGVRAPTMSVPAPVSSPARRATRLESETSRHLQQAQLLLRSIRNTQAASASELDYERALSRELVARNRLLRRRAEQQEDAAATEVLVHVEPLLLDIANLRDQAASEEIASLQSLIRAQGLIAQLQLYASLNGS
jgi:hypothetical protein